MAPLGGAPRLVLLFSGKRKSGKDFVTEALQSRWGVQGGGWGGWETPRQVARGAPGGRELGAGCWGTGGRARGDRQQVRQQLARVHLKSPATTSAKTRRRPHRHPRREAGLTVATAARRVLHSIPPARQRRELTFTDRETESRGKGLPKTTLGSCLTPGA